MINESIRNDAKKKILDPSPPKEHNIQFHLHKVLEWAEILHGNENVLYLLPSATGVTKRKHREPSGKLDCRAELLDYLLKFKIFTFGLSFHSV